MMIRTIALTRSALARLLGLPHGAAILGVEDHPGTGLLTVVVGAAGLPPEWRPPAGVRLKLTENPEGEHE